MGDARIPGPVSAPPRVFPVCSGNPAISVFPPFKASLAAAQVVAIITFVLVFLALLSEGAVRSVIADPADTGNL